MLEVLYQISRWNHLKTRRGSICLNVPTKKSELKGWLKWAAFVLGFMGFITIFIGVKSGDPAPIIAWAAFTGIFVAVFLYAWYSRVTIAIPDRPSIRFGAQQVPAPYPVNLASRSCPNCERMISPKLSVCPYCKKNTHF